MGFPILVRQHLYIESGPRWCKKPEHKQPKYWSSSSRIYFRNRRVNKNISYKTLVTRLLLRYVPPEFFSNIGTIYLVMYTSVIACAYLLHTASCYYAALTLGRVAGFLESLFAILNVIWMLYGDSKSWKSEILDIKHVELGSHHCVCRWPST